MNAFRLLRKPLLNRASLIKCNINYITSHSLQGTGPAFTPIATRHFSQSAVKRAMAAADVPAPKSKLHGSIRWQFEHAISIALIPLIATPMIMGPSKTVDFMLGVVVPLHLHLGMEQIITDYLNKRKIGVMGNKVVVGTLYAATALTMYGLYKFNTSDVGITDFVARAWNANKK